MKYKIAIIGASTGQYPLCLKAKEMGCETYCFAWNKGAVCKDIVDKFYDISITDTERIIAICKDEGIKGVLSNASDFPVQQAAYIAQHLGLNTTPYDIYIKYRDKYNVRVLCNTIKELAPVRFYKYTGQNFEGYPVVIKPVVGGGKMGVSYAHSETEWKEAINYAKQYSNSDLLVEEYIEGKEISVETLSYRGEHYVLQITDKQSLPAPHFVEIGHHQPAQLSVAMWSKVCSIVHQLLNAIGMTYGASHIEMKYNEKGDVFLIEINMRGGGGCISSKLVQLSTGADYLRYMIECALGTFRGINYGAKHYAGIYFLCEQTSKWLSFFQTAGSQEWLIEKKIDSLTLTKSTSNFDRNGYLIYCSDKRINPQI